MKIPAIPVRATGDEEDSWLASLKGWLLELLLAIAFCFGVAWKHVVRPLFSWIVWSYKMLREDFWKHSEADRWAIIIAPLFWLFITFLFVNGMKQLH